MTIGILVNTFEADVGGLAGGHVHVIEIAKRWPESDLRIFAPSVARAIFERELPAAKIIAMPSGERFFRNRQLRNLYRTLAGIGRRRELRKCEVLIATSHFLPDVVPALMALPGRTIVAIHHILTKPQNRAGSKLANVISTVFESLAFVLTRTFAAAVFVYTQEVAAELFIDRRRTRIFIMSNGANAPAETATAAETRRQGAMYLGRIEPTKGVDDVLRAWALLANRGVRSQLTLAGRAAPEYLRHVKDLARQLGIEETISFVGAVSDVEKSRLLHATRVFAFASKEEGWGLVLAEAMCHGAPCLTYDLPAFRDVFVQGRVCVPVGDIDAFADCLALFLTDDAYQQRFASEALESGPAFSWERAAELEFAALQTVAR